jgi:DNA replication protein DnaC
MSPIPKKVPIVTLDPVATKLAALGLDYPAGCLPELVEQATREQLSPLTFLELVLSGELDRKDERRVTTMLKLSGLPSGKTLEDFDWSFQPRVDRRQIEDLSKRSRPAATSARRRTSCFSGRRGSARVISPPPSV